MSDQSRINPIQILLVEDNYGDIHLAKEALKESKVYSKLNVVMDGQEAIDYLRKEKNYADAIRPDLILLDLNLPKKSGVEVLEEIKNDTSLRLIPVVVLTSSEEDVDIIKTYSLHANCYITKPVNLDRLFTIVKNIEEFWFTVVKLPPASIQD